MVSRATTIQPACTSCISWREILPLAHSWTKSLQLLLAAEWLCSCFVLLQAATAMLQLLSLHQGSSHQLQAGVAQLIPLLTTFPLALGPLPRAPKMSHNSTVLSVSYSMYAAALRLFCTSTYDGKVCIQSLQICTLTEDSSWPRSCWYPGCWSPPREHSEAKDWPTRRRGPSDCSSYCNNGGLDSHIWEIKTKIYIYRTLQFNIHRSKKGPYSQQPSSHQTYHTPRFIHQAPTEINSKTVYLEAEFCHVYINIDYLIWSWCWEF